MTYMDVYHTWGCYLLVKLAGFDLESFEEGVWFTNMMLVVYSDFSAKSVRRRYLSIFFASIFRSTIPVLVVDV